ncbi:MAG: MerR family transcriptional regulator [Planctomycetota bacterium]|nr:MerR family transcriptional regulator [Planctomycetota bacterium]
MRKKEVDEKNLLGTQQLCKKTGLSMQVVYQYLLLGIIKPEKRLPNGRLLFSKNTVNLLKLFHKLNRSGYPLQEIKEIFIEHLGKKL